MKAQKISAALFDMDGTVFDTEAIYRRAWLAAGIPEALYRTYIGSPRQRIREIFTANNFDPDYIFSFKDEYVKKELEKAIPLKPGAEECLRWLKENGYRTAIATSSSLNTALGYLERSGLNTYFDAVVSGNQVENGKPAPDIFLKAAAELKKDPSECIVLEDSKNGVRAGRSAGMTTIMIPDLVPADDEMREKADAIFKTLFELPDFLSR